MYLIKTGNKFVFFVFLFFALLIVACGDHVQKNPGAPVIADNPFSKKLATILQPIDTEKKKGILPLSDNVRFTYMLDNYLPLWVDENNKPVGAVDTLIAELEDIRNDGIDPVRYKLGDIKKLKEKMEAGKNISRQDAIIFDTTLTHYYLAAAKDLLVGKISPKKADSLWFHVNDTSWSGPRILANAKGNYPSLDLFRSKVPTYALLREAYKRYSTLAADSAFNDARIGIHYMKHPDSGMIEDVNWVIKLELPWVETIPNDTISEEYQLISAFQFYNNLRITGSLDSATYKVLATRPDSFLAKISANMERVRWMQQKFGDLYMVVDVPLMELFFRKNSGIVMHMRTVVGKPERQTPSLFAVMANIVINPPWGVPPTILKNDVLPGLQKSGQKYLTKKEIKIYDRKGKRVKASVVNAGNYKRYDYRQDPSDDNALGYVKFNLPNPWDIYLHDTPHRGDFGNRYRALSSGCIRLQRPLDLAVYILSELERKRYTLDRLDSIIDTHKTRWELLRTKIPVHIAYLTAFEDSTGQHLRFARDVYNRDEKLISLLK